MVKTTVLLRDDVYHLIVSRFGKRELSTTINRFLYEGLVKPEKEGFGMLSGKLKGFEREHEDRF
ncbi:MAG: hypothetical protein JXB14_01675 [Candidatus Altiarchaeota archaeon]|nr:hypothetical protein [Candidatus Altiarchaeota archaeon]